MNREGLHNGITKAKLDLDFIIHRQSIMGHVSRKVCQVVNSKISKPNMKVGAFLAGQVSNEIRDTFYSGS